MGVTQKYDKTTDTFVDTVVETPPRPVGRGGKENNPLMLKPVVDPGYARHNFHAISSTGPHHGHGTQKPMSPPVVDVPPNSIWYVPHIGGSWMVYPQAKK
eukprot:13004418-Ditylum_brightwellii.AAC.1